MFKKLSAFMLVIPMLLMYSGGMNVASAAESDSDSTRVGYTCDADAPLVGEIEIEMEVVVNGTAPESVEAGSDFQIEDSYTVVTLMDTSLMKVAMEEVEGQVTTFNLTADNAVVADGEGNTINVADPAIDIPSTPFPDEGDTVTFQVPEGEGLTVDPFTAGKEGTIKITAGDIDTVLNSNLGDIEASCSPNEPVVVNTIDIEEADEKDTVAPVITLNGDNPMELEVGDAYEEPGATAEDNVDGDVSDGIEISGEVNTEEPGEYTVTYTVSDEAGNEATETRTVNVVEAEPELEKPELELNGDNPMEVEVGDAYEEPGATANDANGEVEVDINGDVDTSKPGEYMVTYTATNEAGTTTNERIVNVVEADEPEEPEGPVEVNPGDDPADVEAGDEVHVGDNTTVMLPSDLPEGTTLEVSASDRSGGNELDLAGDVFDFNFEFPEGDEPSESYTLVMQYDTDMYAADEVDIYYYDEETGEWVAQNGDVDAEAGTVTVQASHFSTYGVFARVEPEPGDEASGAWYTGEGEPNGELGMEGDLYLDESTFDVYKKEADGWELFGNLKGEDGEDGQDGNLWLVGEGEPTAEVGNHGDLYLDTDSGDVYQKYEVSWNLVANIKGEQGEPGAEGPKGDKGDDGDQGPAGDCDCEDDGDDDGDNAGDGDSDDNGDEEENGTEATNDNGDGGELPETATNNPLFMLIGSLMAIIGGAVIFIRKKALS